MRLSIPASPAFLDLVLVTVTAVARRLGFSITEVEEVRELVDEHCADFLVHDHAKNGARVITVVCTIDGRDLVVDGTGPGSHFEFCRRHDG